MVTITNISYITIILNTVIGDVKNILMFLEQLNLSILY